MVFNQSRRNFIKKTLLTSMASSLPFPLLSKEKNRSILDGKTLVVLELSGGNDGLNTIIPYGDDNYYNLRPNIGIKENNLIKIDEYFGFNSGMVGLESLYKSGNVAIIHGCGYENPSFSHFTSMSYMHTAAPNSGEEYGWMGRLADHIAPGSLKNFLINIDKTQSLAVKSKFHVPIVFDKPMRFVREGAVVDDNFFTNTDIFSKTNLLKHNQKFLIDISKSAKDASNMINQAWLNYPKNTDYGLASLDLDKIAALIKANAPARLYYTSFRDNAFDTHVYQNNLHGRLLTYFSDAVRGFMEDLKKFKKLDDVVLMVITEFGRRVPENTSLGTDHGSAGPIFIIGNSVKGGHYGKMPDLINGLDEGDNLNFTTDFRQVYATLIEKWMKVDSKSILGKNFDTFNIFNKNI